MASISQQKILANIEPYEVSRYPILGCAERELDAVTAIPGDIISCQESSNNVAGRRSWKIAEGTDQNSLPTVSDREVPIGIQANIVTLNPVACSSSTQFDAFLNVARNDVARAGGCSTDRISNTIDDSQAISVGNSRKAGAIGSDQVSGDNIAQGKFPNYADTISGVSRNKVICKVVVWRIDDGDS